MSTTCTTGASATQTTTSTPAPKKTVTTTKPAPKPLAVKAEAVLAEKEIGRMVDLGLGRGVDATSPKPWINKSAFQVRRVDVSNVIGTEEGGSLQSYEREISSVHTQQSDLKASIAVPQAPVTIGVDAEHSRSFSSTRRAVGKKVINRTISFRADFEDVPQSRTLDPALARMEASAMSIQSPVGAEPDRDTVATSAEQAKDTVTNAQGGLTFEERLCTWIMARIKNRQELVGIRLASDGQPLPHPEPVKTKGDPLTSVAAVINEGDDESRKNIVRDCFDFVYHFRITHYVSEIELGAAEYRVLSQQEYYSKIGAAGTLGIEALASFAVSQSASWKKTKRASDVKRIGLITGDGKVVRGSYDEAVVGIKIQPISNLVRLRYLQLALRKALVNYVDDQGDQSSGPFLISCCNDTMFWSVDTARDYAVVTTREPRNASLFYIIPDDDGNNPYEFIIGYYGDKRRILKHSHSMLTPVSKRTISPIPRYLEARVALSGVNSGPLHLKLHVKERHSRLTLHSRLLKRSTAVDTAPWVSGRETFFINCSRRKLKKDGYICVKQSCHGHGEPEFVTACVPSPRHHNDRTIFMLFRLLPGSYRDKESTFEDTDDKIDSELGEYEASPAASGGLEMRSDKSKGVSFAKPSPGSVRFLEPSPPGKRRLDTSGGTLPPVGEPFDLPELSRHPVTDLTKVTVTADTNL